MVHSICICSVYDIKKLLFYLHWTFIHSRSFLHRNQTQLGNTLIHSCWKKHPSQNVFAQSFDAKTQLVVNFAVHIRPAYQSPRATLFSVLIYPAALGEIAFVIFQTSECYLLEHFCFHNFVLKYGSQLQKITITVGAAACC